MLHVARRNGYTKVMVGDSCTRVSVKLLTNLSLGRGAFLAMDTVRTKRLMVSPPTDTVLVSSLFGLDMSILASNFPEL